MRAARDNELFIYLFIIFCNGTDGTLFHHFIIVITTRYRHSFLFSCCRPEQRAWRRTMSPVVCLFFCHRNVIVLSDRLVIGIIYARNIYHFHIWTKTMANTKGHEWLAKLMAIYIHHLSHPSPLSVDLCQRCHVLSLLRRLTISFQTKCHKNALLARVFSIIPLFLIHTHPSQICYGIIDHKQQLVQTIRIRSVKV